MNSTGLTDYRIALLIDADNSPAAKVEVILSELSKLGVTNIRRAYGNWKKAELRPWEERLHEFAIRPMQQFDYSKGKNASDMAMVVDAMELLYLDKPQAFAIVSSDADFTPLVMHLKSKGAVVFGFGQKHAPEPFVKACTKFLFLDQLVEPDLMDTVPPAVAAIPIKTGAADSNSSIESLDVKATQDVPSAGKIAKQISPPSKLTPEQLRRDNKLIGSLRESVAAVEDESGWSRVGAVGSHMNNKSSFDARNYGYPTLTKLLVATDAFDLQEEGTSQVRVKIRRHPLPEPTGSKSLLTTAKKVRAKVPVIQEQSKNTLVAAPDIVPIQSPIDEVKKISLIAPAWELGEMKELASFGKSLRDLDIKRGNEPLHAVFGRHPEYFELTPNDFPRQVKLIKQP